MQVRLLPFLVCYLSLYCCQLYLVMVRFWLVKILNQHFCADVNLDVGVDDDVDLETYNNNNELEV